MLMSFLFLNVMKLKEFSYLVEIKTKEISIIDEAFYLISLDPPFRIMTVKNLLRLIFSLIYGKEIGKIKIKDINNFNETYLHSIYKVMEYLQNEVFASFMLEIFEEEIKNFEYFI